VFFHAVWWRTVLGHFSSIWLQSLMKVFLLLSSIWLTQVLLLMFFAADRASAVSRHNWLQAESFTLVRVVSHMTYKGPRKKLRVNVYAFIIMDNTFLVLTFRCEALDLRLSSVQRCRPRQRVVFFPCCPSSYESSNDDNRKGRNVASVDVECIKDNEKSNNLKNHSYMCFFSVL